MVNRAGEEKLEVVYLTPELIRGSHMRNRPRGLSVWFLACSPVQLHEPSQGNSSDMQMPGPQLDCQNQNPRESNTVVYKMRFPPNRSLSQEYSGIC